MARPTRVRLTDEERDAKRRREQELTEQAVAQLRSSAGWQRWIRTRAALGCRRYSLRNQLMIAMQDETATRVAGFRAWLNLGYCVRRGEVSHIRVWAPCPPSKRKIDAWRKAGANPADRPRTYFRLEAVFAADQVDPLPPPADPAPLDPPSAEIIGDSLAWALQPLDELAGALGYSVVEENLSEGHGGSCDYKARVITINAGWSVNARVSVRCHEIGHALVRADHQDDDPELDYAAGELVAESIAHLACSFLGLDSSAAAIPYLAGWAEAADPDSFEQIAGLVDRLARRLENALGADDQAEAAADVEASPAPADERPLALAVS